MKQDYQAAQEDPTLRQDFLETVHLEDAQEYIKSVIYFDKHHWTHKVTGIKENVLVDGFMYIPHVQKGIVLVSPNAFNRKYEDFLSILIDHEGHHARQRMEAKGFWRAYLGKKPNPLLELPAISNQMERFCERGVSFPFYVTLLGHFSRFEEEIQKNPHFKRDLEKMLCKSPYDDALRERFGL